MLAGMTQANRISFGGLLYFAGAILASLYFAFSAVQGDYGVFRRTELTAEIRALRAELAEVEAERLRMENLARRLSDDYLDLDLLDERARDVLGQMRADEIVIR